MRRLLILAFGLFFLYNISICSDKVTSTSGNVFICDINSIDSEVINITVEHKGKEINTYLNLADVSSYEWNGNYTFLRALQDSTSIKIISTNTPQPNVVKENVYAGDKRGATNAVNFGFFGLQSAALSISYEHLFNSKHGLVVGVPTVSLSNNKEHGLSLSYRNHFRNTMNSGYIGLFARYSNVKGALSGTGTDLEEYKFTHSSLIIGPNIGRRWITPEGFTFAIRLGYGVPLARNFHWVDTLEDEEAGEFFESAFKIISGFDIELSIGFCF